MNTSPALLFFGFSLAFSAFGQAPGSVDTTFSADQTPGWILQAVQADGKVLVAGYPVLAMARLNPDGSYDRSFVPRGISFHRTADSVADWPITVLAPQGKVLVGMQHGTLGLSDGEESALVRLNADGSVDPTFRYRASLFLSPGPKIISIPDGSVLVDQMRIKPDGSVDESFHPKFAGCGSDTWRFEAWQPDGRILLRVYSVCGVSVVRLLADGTLDPDFHSATTDGDVATVEVLADKRILISGPFSAVNRVNRSRLAWLKSDGNLDESSALQARITIDGQS